jgi:sugar O-acyltransferase (sialic acid O-acetyltransferase NeuD family)
MVLPSRVTPLPMSSAGAAYERHTRGSGEAYSARWRMQDRRTGPAPSMKHVVIIGSGGHGREVRDLMMDAVSCGTVTILGFIDEDRSVSGETRDGLPILGGWQWLAGQELSNLAAVVAVGVPSAVRRLAHCARSWGLGFIDVVSPTSRISPRAALGEGVVLFPHTYLGPGARLGDHVCLNVGASVSHDTVIGAYTIVNPGARIAGNVFVGEGCYIGMGSQILQGRRVGAGTVIGAGAVVLKDLPASVTAIGVPAKIQDKRGFIP